MTKTVNDVFPGGGLAAPKALEMFSYLTELDQFRLAGEAGANYAVALVADLAGIADPQTGQTALVYAATDPDDNGLYMYDTPEDEDAWTRVAGTEATARAAAIAALQTNINGLEDDLEAADTARIAGDAGLQTSIDGIGLRLTTQIVRTPMVDGMAWAETDGENRPIRARNAFGGTGGFDGEGPVSVTAPTYLLDAASRLHAPLEEDVLYVIRAKGQSNDDAQNADASDDLIYDAPVDDGSEDYILMPSVGIRPGAENFTSFTSIVEDLDTVNRRESGLAACLHHLHRMIFDGTGQRISFCGYISARSGQPMRNLMRGSEQHAEDMAILTRIVKAAPAAGFRRVVDLGDIITQGEAEEVSPGVDDPLETTRTEMMDLRRIDFQQRDEDIRKITGQTERRFQWALQVNAGLARSANASDFDQREAPLAVAEMQRLGPPFRCVGTAYHLPRIVGDELHYSCRGQERKGILYAQAIARDYFGQGFTGWDWGDVIEWTSTSVCEVRHAIAARDYPLVLDTSGDDVSVTGMVTTLGWQALTRSGLLSFTPTVVASKNGILDRVRFTFTGSVTEPVTLYYAQTADAARNGPLEGARGVLRSSRVRASLTDAHPVKDFCPAYSLFIGRP